MDLPFDYVARRECRGLIFCAETHKVISRRLHKFFNIGELPETQAELIDITRPHIILEKMDGYLLHDRTRAYHAGTYTYLPGAPGGSDVWWRRS